MSELLLLGAFFLLILLALIFIYFKLKDYLDKRLSDPLFTLRERLQDLTEIRRDLQRLYLAEDLLRTLRDEVLRLSNIFTSRKSGKAAERALEELLSQVPSHLLKREVKIGGGEVEFALLLSDGRLLPVDSKFIAPEFLSKEALSSEEERELFKRIRARAREILPYLRDDKTAGLAVMTCPDGLFPLLQKRVFEDLEKERILLVPYSLLLPVLFFIHFFWDRFGKTYDESLLNEGLSGIEKFTLELERDLEKLSRELKSAENLLGRLKETQLLLKREILKIQKIPQSSINSKEASE
jgi:DNA recombination protein RmuC